MSQQRNIAAGFLRSQRRIVIGIVAVFAVLLVVTAAAGRNYVDKDTLSNSLASKYYSLWGTEGQVELPEAAAEPVEGDA